MMSTTKFVSMMIMTVVGTLLFLFVIHNDVGTSNTGVRIGTIMEEQAIVVVNTGSKTHVQQLHEQLHIDNVNDPRQDIRTNRLLNMEGI